MSSALRRKPQKVKHRPQSINKFRQRIKVTTSRRPRNMADSVCKVNFFHRVQVCREFENRHIVCTCSRNASAPYFVGHSLSCCPLVTGSNSLLPRVPVVDTLACWAQPGRTGGSQGRTYDLVDGFFHLSTTLL